uniref:Secreted protein n=1 Tax=Arundo donax TaxID=35708 RepID=A0A0A9HEA5_ARUDO
MCFWSSSIFSCFMCSWSSLRSTSTNFIMSSGHIFGSSAHPDISVLQSCEILPCAVASTGLFALYNTICSL